MKKELLEEIKDIARKAIRKSDDKVLDEKVHEIDKKTFVSVGGAFDSIIILVEELEKQDANDS